MQHLKRCIGAPVVYEEHFAVMLYAARIHKAGHFVLKDGCRFFYDFFLVVAGYHEIESRYSCTHFHISPGPVSADPI